jgi:hypothetical protein
MKLEDCELATDKIDEVGAQMHLYVYVIFVFVWRMLLVP